MKTIAIIIVLLISAFATSTAQNNIKGKVTDDNSRPIPGATVFMYDLNKGTITDMDGNYEIKNIPNGKSSIQFSLLGYSTIIETNVFNNNSIELNAIMKVVAVEYEEIVISGISNSSQHDNAVKIDKLKINPLTVKSTPNFAEVLTKIPGVEMISKGPGVSKPVIRGLSMNDILILNNGVRFENYQYSSHHPMGIDEFGIEEVEIIKGPASLLYGSDAIGGVINFIKEKPAPVGSIIGDYNMQLFSNTLGMTNNLGIKGASGKFFGGLRVGQKTNSDFLQGGGEYAPNSRFNEWSAKANAGYTGKTGSIKLFYDYNQQKLGLVEDEAIEEITERGRKNELFYQQLNTHLLSSQNKIYLGKYKIDINAAYQNTELIHFAEPEVYEIQMKLVTLTYESKLYFPSGEKSEYIIGFQGLNQINTNLNNRETILLPDASTNNFSFFGLMQHDLFKKMKFQAGIRYDVKDISTQAVGLPADEEYRNALEKNYGSLSGSIGTTYQVSEKLHFRANFAAAYRTPNLAELTSNGQHETRYEIGNQDLVPENSYEGDLSLHYHADNITFDVAGFYNKINNYIYISPIGDTTDTGISIYKYFQSNSVLFGGEAGIHIHPKPIKWLHIEASYATVTGKQQNNDYLPFIPANKIDFEMRAIAEKFGFFKNAFISISSNTAFDQNNAAPDETTTNGYTLIDFSLGGNIKVSNQLISIGLSANNLFDVKYIDHLSTLKEVNLYDSGRNITFNLKIPFGIK